MEASGFSFTIPPVFDGENYQAWAVKMSAFMEGSDLWEAVKDDYEVTPLPENPTINQIRVHKESVTRKAKAKSCLYAAVSPFIFNRIMKFPTAKDIWNFLKIEYEGDEKIRGMKALNLIREFERQQMKENEAVKDFSDRLINLANRIRVLGTDMEDGRIVQKILVSLPERFEATIASLENTKDLSDIRLAELLSALEAQEQRKLMRREVPVEAMEEALPARSQMRASGREKMSWNQQKGNAEGSSSNRGHAEQRHPFESGSAYQRERFDSCKHCGGTNHPHYRCWRRPDVKCNNCHKFGHIARFCQEKDSRQNAKEGAANNEVELMFTASCFATGVIRRSWLVDSGCTHHMSYDEKSFANLDRSFRAKVKIGNGDYINVEGRGDIAVDGLKGRKLISDVLYVPKIDQNLLSVGQLVQKGYKVMFEEGFCLIADSSGKEILKIQMKNKSFSFDPVSQCQQAMAARDNEAELWHRRLGHFHSKGIEFLQKNDMAVGFPILQQKDTSNCRTCVLGKQTRLPFVSSSWRASEKLQLIHTDVCGPMSEVSLNGCKYFIIFIDDFSRMCWIYFLKAKSEVAETFEKFKKQVENECGRSIHIVRSDNGTEYTSASFRSICEESGVQHQFSVPYSPQQNGVSERKNRSIMEMARCMMQEKDMQKKFWAEAANTAVFLQNRLPTKSVSMKTPHEAWYGVKPIMKNLKVFGCVCYTHVPSVKRDKLDQKAEVGIFVGYSMQSKAYRIYQPQNGKVIISRDVKFFEEEKWIWSDRESVSEHTSEMPVLVEWNSEEQNDEEQNIEQQLNSEQNVDVTPIRGTRSLTDIYERCNVAVMEPASFEDAKEDRRWLAAMQEELAMIEKNETWELVDRPHDRKVIGVKWVYRTKLNPDGSVNKHKARLVVKGYSQVWGVDYSETFAPVARLDTIRMILAVAAEKEWKVFQLDVKSAFLNGILQEEIYVEQPEGFCVAESEQKVYRLKKALYGLKQAPRAWYSKIDDFFIELGFERSRSEHTLYVRKVDLSVIIISLYVDDLLVTGNDQKFIQKMKQNLMQMFEMTDLGEMTFFLGMEVNQIPGKIFICQKKYVREILKRFRMEECKSVATPMAQKDKLSKRDSSAPADNAFYRSLVGCLMYLTATRPDILFPVSILSRFMHCASEAHMIAAKRVLRYLKGTSSYGMRYRRSNKFELYGFSDSDWAGSVDDMKSTSGYCFSLGSACFSWCSKKQEIVAQSTAEAEFVAATSAVNQAIWLRKLLNDIGYIMEKGTKVSVDNQAALAISKNPVFHGKTKHFNVKYYYLREVQQMGEVELIYCTTEDQLADIFTKSFHLSRFVWLREKIGVSISA